MRTRSQAAKALALEQSVEGAGHGPLASQTGPAEAPPLMQPEERPEPQVQLEPEERPEPEIQMEPAVQPTQGWETQFREFLEVEEVAWEEQLLMELNPWANTVTFLASFEQVAVACRWPRRDWVTRLLPSLSEEAEKAFVGMAAADRGNFQKVKAAILRRETLTREKKRQEFRRFCYQEADGPREVCATLQGLCHQWLKVERSSKQEILELLILEQFLSVLPKEMQSWVKERGPDTCAQAVALAEDFLQRLEGASPGNEQEPDAVAGSPPKRARSPPQVSPMEVAPTQVQVKRDINDVSSALQKIYPGGYQKARTSKKRNRQWRQSEHTPLRARFPGRANTVFPRPLKQEGSVKDRRYSERLQKSQPVPVCKVPTSPSKKVCKKPEKPTLPQGSLKKTCTVPSSPSKKVCKTPETPPLPQESLKKTCAECGQCFSGLSSFMRHHIRAHTGEKRYECCFCGKGFCWRSDLVRHECIHTGKMPHECSYCGQGFDRKWKRKLHEEDHLKSKASI